MKTTKNNWFAILPILLTVLAAPGQADELSAINNYRQPAGDEVWCRLSAYGTTNTAVWACSTAGESFTNAEFFCTTDLSFCWPAGDSPCPAGGTALGCY